MFNWIHGNKPTRTRKLRDAAAAGNLEVVRKLLKRDVDVNEPDPESGETALNLALNGRYAAVAKELIQAAADVNFMSRDGNTPLFVAANHGDELAESIESLLRAGAQADRRVTVGPNAGANALYVAVARGGIEVFRMLLRRGASMSMKLENGRTIAYALAMRGNAEMLRVAQEHRIDFLEAQDDGHYPMHLAAVSGNADMVRAILDVGTPVDHRDGNNETALLAASRAGRSDIVSLLLTRGADHSLVFGADENAVTPLYAAALAGHDEVVRALLKGGASADLVARPGPSLIALTQRAGHMSAAGLLMNARRRPRAEAGVAKTGEPQRARKWPRPVELGVICEQLRYDEHEHGEQLARLFGKARAEWVSSGNDVASAHYARACKMLSKWFSATYRVHSGFSMSFSLNEDNVVDKLEGVSDVTDSSEAIEKAFSGDPRLKTLEVVSIDFRESASSLPLESGEALAASPDLGFIAIYQVTPGRSFGSPQALAEFIKECGSLISRCFSIQIKDSAIEVVEVDEDGYESRSSSATWSGGELELMVNLDQSSDAFREVLLNRVREARRGTSMLSESVDEAKRLILLADEAKLSKRLDEGLDVDTVLAGESLLRLALMCAATAGKWFEHGELAPLLQSSFGNSQAYSAALKRIVLDLLKRGADVNAPGAEMTTLSLAEMLGDSEILAVCRERASSVDDLDPVPLLLAAERGDAQSVEALLARGARINKRELRHGTTPLMLACQGPGGENQPPLSGEQLTRQEAVVRLLLDRGAEIGARAENGDTAIGNAVRRGNASIVRLLLDAGAETSNALPRGQSLEDMARTRGHLEIIRLLENRQSSSSIDTEALSALLVQAVREGRIDDVRKHLGAGADPTVMFQEDVPVFLVPVLSDQAPLQRALLECGVLPDLANQQGGVTALMLAAARGSRELCDLLLDAGAYIDQRMGSGQPFFAHPGGVDFDMSALGCAVDSRHWDLAAHLLERGAQPGFGVMHTDIALTLAKFAPASLIEKMDRAGYSIVMDHEFLLFMAPPMEMHLPQMRSKVVFWAAMNPDPEVLSWVLSHGGDPLAGNSLGMTSLIVAAAAGNRALVARLLEMGADARAVDCDGDTALSLALERGHADVVRMLRSHLAAGRDPVKTGASLHEAIVRGELDLALDALDAGESPSSRDADGNTPMMLAVRTGRVDLVRGLHAVGATVRLRNSAGKSAWDLSEESPDRRVRISLREFGADDPTRRNDPDRFDMLELAQGRYSHPFKNPSERS